MRQEAQIVSEGSERESAVRRTHLNCWDCMGEVEGFFCKNCGKIQSIPKAADYFSSLGLERKLNVDAQALESRFYALSRKFHPDFYQGKSFKEQEISLENSSALNRAYRTLRDPITKIEYLIRLELGEGEGIYCQVPPDLLEEVLDLHSQLEEIHHLKEGEDPSEQNKIKEYLRTELVKLEVRNQAIHDQILALSDKWDELTKEDGDPCPEKKKILLELKDNLSQRTYLSNVIEDIKNTLN